MAARSDAEKVVDAALAYKGAPYVWGAVGPKSFDCSGLVYRVFKDTGQLPLIGGRRLTAAGYYKWFASRGLTSTTRGARGDLVVFGRGAHIGIYLGDGKVLSAVIPTVKIHGINALITNKFTAFLHVPWGMDLGTQTTSSDKSGTRLFINKAPRGAGDGKGGDQAAPDNQGSSRRSNDRSGDTIATGYAFGSLNVRDAAGPDEEIISWVTRGTTVEILKTGRSPGGALWYFIRKPSGREGWVWSGWMKVVSGSVDG
jgi:cell wall-associated NlpC family hydrolase